MKVEFGKYEGAGNDFVIVDNREENFAPSPRRVAALCNRRFGIGADGLMLLEKDDVTQFRMRYFNSDGPEATMCGNGGRCMVLFAAHIGIAQESIHFNAADGAHHATILAHTEDEGVVSLGMSNVGGVERVGNGYFINTGSPHYVEFVPNVESIDIFATGRRMRELPEFVRRGGANFNFVQIMEQGTLKVRTYERGVEDETFACGTGAVASAIVTAHAHFPEAGSFDIEVRGGKLAVLFDHNDGLYHNIRLIGPARRTYAGSFNLENF